MGKSQPQEGKIILRGRKSRRKEPGRADTAGAPWARSIVAEEVGKAEKGLSMGTAAGKECGFYFRFTGKAKNGFR